MAIATDMALKKKVPNAKLKCITDFFSSPTKDPDFGNKENVMTAVKCEKQTKRKQKTKKVQKNKDVPSSPLQTNGQHVVGSPQHKIIQISQGVNDKSQSKRQPRKSLTDFFPVRRSTRKPKADLDKEFLATVEEYLLADSDDHCDAYLTVANDETKGRCIVASTDITKGQFVVEYAGELLSGAQEARQREEDYAGKSQARVTSGLDPIGCYMYYFKHGERTFCIDATAESGRYGRLLNHSKVSANCGPKIVVFKNRPRLVLVAKRDIKAGEELLYDYGDRSKSSLESHPWLAS